MSTAPRSRLPATPAGPLRRDVTPAVLVAPSLVVASVLADAFDAVRPTFWPDETEPLPAIMRP
jgi:hypothetical protein